MGRSEELEIAVQSVLGGGFFLNSDFVAKPVSWKSDVRFWPLVRLVMSRTRTLLKASVTVRLQFSSRIIS